MIDPKTTAVQECRRIANTLYARSSTQQQILRARHVADVFNVTGLFSFKEFWGDHRMEEVQPYCDRICSAAKELGARTMQDLLEHRYEALCATKAMSIQTMAFLLDYMVAFGLTLEGAPPAPILRASRPAKVAS